MHSMRIHEYRAEGLLAEYGIRIPPSRSVTTVNEAVSATKVFGFAVLVKPQIRNGGRRKSGDGDIVETAKNTPDALVKEWVPPSGSRLSLASDAPLRRSLWPPGGKDGRQ